MPELRRRPEDLGEKIGQGSEQEGVYEDKNPALVVKESGEATHLTLMKASYYLSKIARLLFPESIPNISAAFNKEDGRVQAVVERVDTSVDKRHEVMRLFDLSSEDNSYFDEAYRDAWRSLEKDLTVQALIHNMHVSGLAPDNGRLNYLKKPDGTAVYIDQFDASYLSEWDKKRLLLYIEAIKDKQKKKKAQNFYERIIELLDEYKKTDEYKEKK